MHKLVCASGQEDKVYAEFDVAIGLPIGSDLFDLLLPRSGKAKKRLSVLTCTVCLSVLLKVSMHFNLTRKDVYAKGLSQIAPNTVELKAASRW